jgi:hypothetical protein
MTTRGAAPTIVVIACCAFAQGCSKQTPTAPTSAAPIATPHPSITVASIAVQGEARSSGYAYSATVQLKENAGVAATISGIDVVFLNGATTVSSSHYDHPISDTSAVLPANGSVGTKALLAEDPDASHPYATTIQVKVAFTADGGFASSVAGSTDVPPITAPTAPQTFSLAGVITDAATRAGIAGARLEVLNGQNSGRVVTADGAGAYMFQGLVAETFRLRASADAHDSGEQNVTVPSVPRADFELRPLVATPPRDACPPAATYNEGAESHEFLATRSFACAAGGLGRVAIDVAWLRFLGTHGGTTMLDLVVDANPGAARTGHLTLSDGDRVYTTLTVIQAAGDCVTAISPTSQTFDENGGAGSFAVTAQAGCTWQASVNTSNLINAAITAGAQGVGSGAVSFAVAANPDVFPHGGFVLVGILRYQLTQSACPVTVSSLTVHAPAGGGTFTVNVSAGRAFCAWTDYSNALFIDRPFEQRGGTAAVTFVVAPNSSGQPRSGSLYVAGQTIVVTQDP